MIGPTIEETLQFIQMAHGQQLRRGRVPYYTHPIAASKLVTEFLKDQPDEYFVESAIKASLLHDVVEDTEVTIMQLGKMGYPISILDTVSTLTKYTIERDDETETHRQHVQRVINSKDPVAIIVKACDALHNSIIDPDDKEWCITNNVDMEKQSQKYRESYLRLIEAYQQLADK